MVLFIFVLGLAIGSFLNVLIDRLPNGESILYGRSHCDYCKKILRWYELIPVFSWIMQGGKCRRCHKLLSIQYPLIELVTAFGFVYFFQSWDYPLITFIAHLIIFCSLLVIFVADVKYQIIPDSMVIVGSIAAIMRLIVYTGHPGLPGFLPYALSATGASAFFFLLWFVTRGRGMGLGDVKLAFFLGLLLGFPNIIVALYAAFLTGAGVGVILILRKKKSLKEKVAFGPFLILGTGIALQWGSELLQFWMHLL